ncbi:cytochrome ubiquinol oxidase subunit I [Streptomyces sp. L7]
MFAYGDVSKGHNTVELSIPGILSFLADDDFSSYVPGINDTNKAEQAKYGPGDYRPIIPVTFWAFRWMIGFGMASFAVGLAGLWLTRKKFMLPQHLRVGEDEVPNVVLFKKKALGPKLTKLYWLVSIWTLGFPSSPTPGAGSSPRWAASPGSSTASSRPVTPSPPASPRARSSPR